MKRLIFALFAVIGTLSPLTASADDELKLTKCGGAEETWPYGTYTAGTLEAATQFTADELTDYIGGRITKIRFFAAWTYYYDWFDLWVKTNYDDEVRLAEVRTTDITADLFKWHYYELDHPVEITGEPIALGATFNCTDMTFPLAACILDTPGGMFMRQPDGEWQDFSQYYNLCIEAVVEGVSLDGSAVELTTITLPAHYYSLGEQSTATLTLKNTGADLSSITLHSVCGDAEAETTVDATVQHGSFHTITLPFTVPDHVDANCALSIEVTQIDGKSYEGEPLTATFGAFDAAIARNVVIEEATNTTNPWCVRGIVSMEYMHEHYPDTFIGIAVHSNSDPMGIHTYMSGDLGIENVPGCAVDRLPRYAGESVGTDFYEGYYNAERARLTYADFALTAEVNADKQIVGNVTATFDFDNPTSDLRMVYVVLEDGITGYSMANGYYGGGSGAMDGFEWLPAVIDFLPFDNVARAILPSQFGEPNLPASFKQGDECRHDFCYAIPDNVQDPGRLSLVAMMIDGKSGEVVQAHKVRLAVPDAVETVEGAKRDAVWYTLGGTRLPSAPVNHGLYISSDCKVLVR